MENILEIKDLSKKYDGFELKNINIKLDYVQFGYIKAIKVK